MVLYTNPVCPRHAVAGPLTTGAAGVLLILTASTPLWLPQLLLTLTGTLPDTAVLPQVVVMLLVPWPAVMVTPVGTVQL